MNHEEVLRSLALTKDLSGIFEACHTSSYRCYRKNRGGEAELVTVQVLDMGPDVNPNIRYSVRVETEGGKQVIGNAAESIDVAMRIVHWNALD